MELELTVLQSSKTVCVGTLTRCKITATMPLTAISRERAKLLEAVIFQALLPLVPIPLPVTPFHKSPSYLIHIPGLHIYWFWFPLFLLLLSVIFRCWQRLCLPINWQVCFLCFCSLDCLATQLRLFLVCVWDENWFPFWMLFGCPVLDLLIKIKTRHEETQTD